MTVCYPDGNQIKFFEKAPVVRARRDRLVQYEFLSDDWLKAARAIHAAHLNEQHALGTEIRMNLVVHDVPFGTGQIEAHLDTSSGSMEIDLGHLPSPGIDVRLDYATAKAILIEGDAQAGMEGFMTGKIQVQGDVSKLIAFQSEAQSPARTIFAEQIRSITL